MINDYNAKVRQLVGAELKKLPDLKGFKWMMKKTGYIPEWLPPKNEALLPHLGLFTQFAALLVALLVM
jgi:hypothetical protein